MQSYPHWHQVSWDTPRSCPPPGTGSRAGTRPRVLSLQPTPGPGRGEEGDEAAACKQLLATGFRSRGSLPEARGSASPPAGREGAPGRSWHLDCRAQGVKDGHGRDKRPGRPRTPLCLQTLGCRGRRVSAARVGTVRGGGLSWEQLSEESTIEWNSVGTSQSAAESFGLHRAASAPEVRSGVREPTPRWLVLLPSRPALLCPHLSGDPVAASLSSSPRWTMPGVPGSHPGLSVQSQRQLGDSPWLKPPQAP